MSRSRGGTIIGVRVRDTEPIDDRALDDAGGAFLAPRDPWHPHVRQATTRPTTPIRRTRPSVSAPYIGECHNSATIPEHVRSSGLGGPPAHGRARWPMTR